MCKYVFKRIFADSSYETIGEFMKNLLQQGKIKEHKSSQNTAYILEDDSVFHRTGYKVLMGQEKNGFIKCSKVLHNGKIKLLYFTAGQKNLKNMLSLIDSDTFITIITNIIKSVIDIKNNGFLSCQNLDLSFDKIFVDTHTLGVRLIYLPVNNENDDILSFESELRTDLIKVITSTPAFSNAKMNRISSLLSNGTLSLNELYNSIKSEILGQTYVSPPIDNVSGDNRVMFASQPKLIFTSSDPKNPLKLVINSPNYVIGKNPAKVNGVISFNKAIGRVHCRFVFKNNSYYIIDGDGTRGSTNGTYVNGVRLKDMQPVPVKNRDIIRLANSDFVIEI